AAGAALLARLPTGRSTPAAKEQATVVEAGAAEVDHVQPPASDTRAAPSPTSREPYWSDLLTADRGANEIDVTRVQMLIFTLISAAFVGLKVVVSYEIPEIPENFQLLMGISNGVYIGGRHLPSQT